MKKVIQIGNLIKTKNRPNPQRGRIYSSFGIAPSIYTYKGDNLQPMLIEVIKNGKTTIC